MVPNRAKPHIFNFRASSNGFIRSSILLAKNLWVSTISFFKAVIRIFETFQANHFGA